MTPPVNRHTTTLAPFFFLHGRWMSTEMKRVISTVVDADIRGLVTALLSTSWSLASVLSLGTKVSVSCLTAFLTPSGIAP